MAINNELSNDLQYRVRLFNDKHNALGNVVWAILSVIKCSPEVAEIIVNKAHTEGSVICFSGSYDDCFRINDLLNTWNLDTTLEKIE